MDNGANIQKEIMKSSKIKNSAVVCQLCNSDSLNLIIDLGHHPLADSFLNENQINEVIKTYPLKVYMCQNCGHAMLGHSVSAEERYQDIDYSYTASNSKVSIAHFDEMSKEIGQRVKLNKNDLVVDVGSNDGTLLKAFQSNFGTKIIGIEPSLNISKIAKQNGVTTINDFFNSKTAEKILKVSKAKVITATNVFNHISELNQFTKNIKKILHNDGAFVFEVPYFPDLIKQGAFDTIYLEHISYFNVKPFQEFFSKYDLYISHLETNTYMGGSIRVYVTKTKPKSSSIVKNYISDEKKNGIYDLKTYKEFNNRIIDFKNRLNFDLYQAKLNGDKIIAIGAATKGNTLLNYCKINTSVIEFVTDSSPLKVGKYMPGSHIPIRHDNDITPDVKYALILPWNIADFLVSKLSHLKLKFIIPKMK